MSPKIIIVYFNVRGVGPPKKLLSLKNIWQNINSNVFIIQETKCYGIKARIILELWLKNWSFCSIGAEGQLGGILSGWSPMCKALSSKMFCSTILIKLLVKYFGFPFLILNIYGPYVDRIPLLDDLDFPCMLNESCILFGETLTLPSLRENFGVNFLAWNHKGFSLSLFWNLII